MIEIRQTDIFAKWLSNLRDRKAKTIIEARLQRIEFGLLGDVKSLGDGIQEIRISYGPGYRIYFTKRDQTIIILICGGDKSTQNRDIEYARNMVKML